MPARKAARAMERVRKPIRALIKTAQAEQTATAIKTARAKQTATATNTVRMKRTMTAKTASAINLAKLNNSPSH